ncbi:hypothetical protein Y032_0080g1401 [Ancylostoma ceylanicum]|uniref:Uncharacterized protein n=1 Tax=Ancylostoma ceylanicum TaxID=53326 RepID=A0A016TS25_9BILA|nr:hypothetical protein Y032_0080g1401 [Ancylostoma ceylanicum]
MTASLMRHDSSNDKNPNGYRYLDVTDSVQMVTCNNLCSAGCCCRLSDELSSCELLKRILLDAAYSDLTVEDEEYLEENDDEQMDVDWDMDCEDIETRSSSSNTPFIKFGGESIPIEQKDVSGYTLVGERRAGTFDGSPTITKQERRPIISRKRALTRWTQDIVEKTPKPKQSEFIMFSVRLPTPSLLLLLIRDFSAKTN